jgi:hypothetical protein
MLFDLFAVLFYDTFPQFIFPIPIQLLYNKYFYTTWKHSRTSA